jgi:hypothetical protein
MPASIARILTVVAFSFGLSLPTLATSPVTPPLDARSFVVTWEGLAYVKDTALDYFHLIRLRVSAKGKGALTLGQGFDDETAGTRTLRFEITSWSAKKGFVRVTGRSDHEYLRSFRMQGRGKGVAGTGRIDVDLLIFDPEGRRQLAVSGVDVQGQRASNFSRIEVGLRWFRTEK